MNYNLASRLKDAGFPQRAEIGDAYIDEENFIYFCGSWDCDDSWYPTNGEIYIPTLSELIEACGDNFLHLIKNDLIKSKENNDIKSKWIARSSKPNWDILKNGWSDKDIVSCGETPEEAVANLWLELNKNG